MTKPSEKDREAAKAIAYCICNGEPPGTNGPDDLGAVPGKWMDTIAVNVATAIAQARAEERERCAKEVGRLGKLEGANAERASLRGEYDYVELCNAYAFAHGQAEKKIRNLEAQ